MNFKFLNPGIFLNYCISSRKYLFPLFLISLIAGLILSIFSPEDYQQGVMVRIMYIHVPSAWLSLMIFMIMGFASISNIIWRVPTGFYIAYSASFIGAVFSLITLLTGMIWGKPIWGTWWVWDARLTSMLILFIFYLCYILIATSSNNLSKIEKPASVIAIIGMINVPIVKFSVDIWYSLHQPASVLKLTGPSIHISMLLPLLVMFLANFLLFLLLFSLSFENLINKKKITQYFIKV